MTERLMVVALVVLVALIVVALSCYTLAAAMVLTGTRSETAWLLVPMAIVGLLVGIYVVRRWLS
jgi:hypothetical protein